MFKLLNNTKANPDNTLVIAQSETGCCGASAKGCKYSFTAVYPIADITIAGSTVTFPAAAGDASTLNAEIMGAFKGLGYDDFESAGIRVDGDDFTIYSEAKVESLGAITPVEACTPVAACYYAGSTDGSATSISFNGSVQALVPVAYPAQEATLKANIEAAATAAGFDAMMVTVEDNAALGKYWVKIKAKQGSVIMLGADTLKECDCVADFEA